MNTILGKCLEIMPEDLPLLFFIITILRRFLLEWRIFPNLFMDSFVQRFQLRKNQGKLNAIRQSLLSTTPYRQWCRPLCTSQIAACTDPRHPCSANACIRPRVLRTAHFWVSSRPVLSFLYRSLQNAARCGRVDVLKNNTMQQRAIPVRNLYPAIYDTLHCRKHPVAGGSPREANVQIGPERPGAIISRLDIVILARNVHLTFVCVSKTQFL